MRGIAALKGIGLTRDDIIAEELRSPILLARERCELASGVSEMGQDRPLDG